MWITDLIKFLIEDTKKDIKFFKQLRDGTYKFPYTKEQLKEAFNPVTIIKENWVWFLLLIAAFCCGYFISSVGCHNSCVAMVEESGILDNTLYPLFNQSFNFSQ